MHKPCTKIKKTTGHISCISKRFRFWAAGLHIPSKQMKKIDSSFSVRPWFTALLLSAMAVGCGGGDGGRDPILGTDNVSAILVPPAGAIVPGLACPVAGPSVTSTDPTNGNQVATTSTSGVANRGKLITATFSEAMDPATINAATFKLAPDGGGVLTPASVSYNAAAKVATLVTSSALTAGTAYTALIQGTVTSGTNIPLGCSYTWKFKTAASAVTGLPPVNLLSASRYGIFGGSAGMTNTGIQTVIVGSNGATADIGTTATGTSSITGFHDSNGDIYTEPPQSGNVTGKIYSCTVSTTGPTSAAVNPASCTTATNALADALAAYNTLVALPVGPNPDQGAGSLANLVLAPGVYKAAGGSFKLQGGNLTLAAQGDANAAWVFQMATTLTVGGPGAAFPQSVILVNGAQAKNVFWQVGSAATINAAGGGTMVGTIISQAGTVFSTVGNTAVSTLNGRALSLDASVTLVNTVINVPAP